MYLLEEGRGGYNVINDAVTTKILRTTRDACRREVRLKYRLLAQKYHPDKWAEKYQFSKKEVENYFKDIFNTYQHLLETARN